MGSNEYVDCSGRLVLECGRCGERLILLGLADDWRSERTAFECGCGESVTLADRRNEASLAFDKPAGGGFREPNA